MRAKSYCIPAVSLAVCAGVLWAANAPKGEGLYEAKSIFAKTQRDVLKGLQGVTVVVEDLAPKVQEYLSKEELQNDAELLLRKYGIKVLTDEERLRTTGLPFLYINASAHIWEDLGIYSVGTKVELRESVWLMRSPTTYCYATTWDECALSTGTLSELRSECRENVKDLVETFANDYLAANPKGVLEESAWPGIGEEFTERKIWVKCRNVDCQHKWQISSKEYFEFLERYHREHRGEFVIPGLACPKCGENEGFEAAKCGKCGLVFEKGAMGREDFEDRCPKCGYSKIEEERKKAAEARRRAGASERNK